MDETPLPPESQPSVPPPLPPAPPVITPPPPVKPRKSRGWMIAAILLAGLLFFSVFGNFAQLASHAIGMPRNFKSVSSRQVGPKLEECILEDNDSRNKIVVITVDGIITSHTGDGAGNNMVDLIKAQLDRAADDDHVRAVILKVDSPGGEVMASDQINKAIRHFEDGNSGDSGQPRHGKPVVCSMGSLAASGGYYISAPCKWIVADDLTLTGSIGVIMHGYNYRGLMDKIGVLPMTYKSGLYKDMLSPDRSTNDIPAGERAMVQGLIDETYQKFKGVVKDGRKAALKTDWESLADGRVLSGQQALDAGFVDELGDFDDAVDKAEDLTHIHKANLIEYQERYDISNFLSMFGENNKAHDIKLDLGMEAPKLQPGCMYFLTPNFVNY